MFDMHRDGADILMQTAAKQCACLSDSRGEKGPHINGKLEGSIVKSN